MDSPLTPLQFMRRTRRLHGEREAVVDGALRLTYEQFGTRCSRWAAALAELGVRRGDRVGTIAPNTHQHLEQFYAVPLVGAVLVPMNYRLTANDFVYMVNHSGCKVLCVHETYLETIEGVRDRLTGVEHFVALEGSCRGWRGYESLIAAAEGPPPQPELDEKDLISINYTSGTTSKPKGVMITHRNAWVNAIGTLTHWPMTCADRYLWTLPMFHANGWTFTWIVTAVGGAHVCVRHIDARTIHGLINDERVTTLCAAPTVLISLASVPEDERRSVRRGVRLLTAGAPPAPATLERVEGELGWNVTHIYGLTETSPFILVCEPLPEQERLAPSERAVLKARQGVELITSGELRVVTREMEEVPRDGNSVGEIVVRGSVVMEGYYKDPGATAAAFAGGWFHTGDAAVVHPDGYVEIRDRFKDVIISGGENISTIEVEGELLRHPAVLEVAVIGVPHEKWGESPKAFIVLRPNEHATEADLLEFARARLAHFKAPTSFEFVAALPKTATGKIQKFILRGGRANLSRQ